MRLTRPITRIAALCFALAALAVLRGAERAPLADLERPIVALLRGANFKVAVAIKDLTSGEELLVNPDESLPIGSSVRIHLVTELYRQASVGRLSLNEVRPLPESARTGGLGVLRFMGKGTVSMGLRDYASLMVTAADNTAANFLTDVVGMDAVNASLQRDGLGEIQFRRRAVSRRLSPNVPENVGTARACLRALERLHRGQVVDRATSDAVLELLSYPELGYVRRELPAGVAFAGLSASGPGMRCDQGIVRLAGRPYIFCALMSGPSITSPRTSGLGSSDQLMTSLSKTVWKFFSARAPAAVPPPATK